MTVDYEGVICYKFGLPQSKLKPSTLHHWHTWRGTSVAFLDQARGNLHDRNRDT